MRPFAFAVLLAEFALVASAAPKGPVLEKVSVGQLRQTLVAAAGKTDTDLAQQLSDFKLTERLNSTQLAGLNAMLPGEKSRQALLLLGDEAVFLDPPNSEIPNDPTPSSATTRQMLVRIVDYVNTTSRQLPNFIAARETAGFEDRPHEDVQEATAVVSLSYLPLHLVGQSSAQLTYRDGHEVVENGKGRSMPFDARQPEPTEQEGQAATGMTSNTVTPKPPSNKPDLVGTPYFHSAAPDVERTRAEDAAAKGRKRGPQVHGLATVGEFGPILSTVVGDALKGQIIWARWERGSSGSQAVFRYTVPKEKSNYVVKFCCIADSIADGLRTHIFGEREGYHGEIAFDPADGAILRMTLEADLTPGELVSKAGLSIEYGPVKIGDRSYICPTRSVSVLQAHTTPPREGMHMAVFDGMPKTFLNDVAYSHYRRFGSEARILVGENPAP